MGRKPCCEKVGLKRGRWTAEEDEILINYIQTHGEGSWRSLPKNAGLLRCGKSCRLRWINYLRTDLKRGNISPQEEQTIVKLHSSLGSRWSLIASHLPGRTDNEIKNYWNSHLSRKLYSFTSNGRVPTILELSNLQIPTKKRKGRTSRRAMNKNKFIISPKKHSPNNNNVLLPPTATTHKPALDKQILKDQTNSGVNSPLRRLERSKDVNSGTDEPVDVAITSRVQEASGVPLQDKNSLILCPTNCVDLESVTEPSGQYQSIDFDEMLCFDHVVDYDLLHSVGVFNLQEGTQGKVINKEGESCNLSSNESCSSLASSFDHDQESDWTWEDLVSMQEIWGEKDDDDDDVLPWLGSNNGIGIDENIMLEGVENDEMRRAMVSWLLS